MFYVYCHTNKVNGKKYVGITWQEPERRWANGKAYIANEKFYKEIVDFGWDGFAHEIIADGLTQEEAVQMEAKLIREYDCFGNGYNNSRGGHYGKRGFLSPECNKIKHNLKRFSYASDHYEFFCQADKDKRLGDWLNYFVPVAVEFLSRRLERPYGMNLSDELDLAVVVREVSYIAQLEYAMVTDTEKPEYVPHTKAMQAILGDYNENNCRFPRKEVGSYQSVV